jgi:hypothetical protein
MDAKSEKLGPEFISLMNRMQEMDPSSKEGQEITATLVDLDKLCVRSPDHILTPRLSSEKLKRKGYRLQGLSGLFGEILKGN